MKTPTPQIGFDRFIQLDWIVAALSVRMGASSIETLNAALDTASLGKEAKAKTITKLNALVLKPRADLVDFIDRGIKSLTSPAVPSEAVLFSWGAAISAYPYFGKVAELTGRLLSIQGECSVAEIHRRMSEVYGDREITKRATQAVIQAQANWGVIERVEKGRRLVRKASILVRNEQAAVWLIEASLRYVGKAVSVPALSSLAVLYPFVLDQSIAYLASKSPNLDIRAEGAADQLISVHSS